MILLHSVAPTECELKLIVRSTHRLVFILLPVVYGCESWSLTLRDKSRLKMFENRVLRRLFGSKRGRVKKEVEKTT